MIDAVVFESADWEILMTEHPFSNIAQHAGSIVIDPVPGPEPTLTLAFCIVIFETSMSFF
jgi:hypothetical protein